MTLIYILYIFNYFDVFSALFCADARFLQKPDKHDLLNLLASIRHLWFEIGEALEVPNPDLMCLFYRNCPESTKLSLVLKQWIDQCTTEVTWNTIIAVVKSDFIGQTAVGEKIQTHVLNINQEDNSSHYDSDMSSGHGKELAEERPYKKNILHKRSKGHKKHKGKFNFV